MGQKVNPIGLRLGINRTWDSRWYANKREYGALLHEDIKIRRFLQKRLHQAGVSRIVIERPAKKARVTIYTARPGLVIGKKGADIEKLRQALSTMTGSDVHLNIVEIRKPEIDAKLVAENICNQLERRPCVLVPWVFGSIAAVVWAGRKSLGPNGIARGGCLCIPCAPTLITALLRPLRHMAPAV